MVSFPFSVGYIMFEGGGWGGGDAVNVVNVLLGRAIGVEECVWIAEILGVEGIQIGNDHLNVI